MNDGGISAFKVSGSAPFAQVCSQTCHMCILAAAQTEGTLLMLHVTPSCFLSGNVEDCYTCLTLAVS